MKTLTTRLFVLLLMLAVLLICGMLGCATSTTTTTTPTANGGQTVTTTETFTLNTAQLAAVAEVASDVWGLIQQANTVTAQAEASPSVLDAVTDAALAYVLDYLTPATKQGAPLDKAAVLAQSAEIAVRCLQETGRAPVPEHVAAFVLTRQAVTEAALIDYAKTGMLIAPRR